jgi:NAD(P)-dependent dehydrogenase (short-subunit alcohol dehydrogenase family)
MNDMSLCVMKEANQDYHSVLVNNAGICEMRPFAMSTVESVWRQVEVNFKGVRPSHPPSFPSSSPFNANAIPSH